MDTDAVEIEVKDVLKVAKQLTAAEILALAQPEEVKEPSNRELKLEAARLRRLKRLAINRRGGGQKRSKSRKAKASKKRNRK
jgi:hypothetical protein